MLLYTVATEKVQVGRTLRFSSFIYIVFIKIHLHLCCVLSPKAFRHLLFLVSPCEAKSDIELIGNRSQVVRHESAKLLFVGSNPTGSYSAILSIILLHG